MAATQPQGAVTKQTLKLSEVCEVPAPTFPVAASSANVLECSYSHQAYINNLVVVASLGGVMLLLVYLWRRLESIQRKSESANPGAQSPKEVHFVEPNTGLEASNAGADTTVIRLFGDSSSSPLLGSCEVRAASQRWPTVLATDSCLTFPEVPHLDEANLDDCRVPNGGHGFTTQKLIESSKPFKSSTPTIQPAPVLPWIEKDRSFGTNYVAPNLMPEIIIPATSLAVTSVRMSRETLIANAAVTRPVLLRLLRPNPSVSEPLDQSNSTISQLSGYSTSPIFSDPGTPDPSREPNGVDQLGSDFSHHQGANLSPHGIAQEIVAFQDSAARSPRLLSALVPHSRVPWSSDAWCEDDRDLELLSTVAQPPTPSTDIQVIMLDPDVDIEDQIIRDADLTKPHDTGADHFGRNSINPSGSPPIPSSPLASKPEGESYSWPSERYARSQLTITPVSNAAMLPDYESDRVFAAQLFTSRLLRPLETPLDTDIASQQVVAAGGEMEDVTPSLRRNENPGSSRFFSQPRCPLDLPRDPISEPARSSKLTVRGERSNKPHVMPVRQPTAPSSLPGFTASHATQAKPKPAPAPKQGTDQSAWAYSSDSNSHGLNSRSWRRGHRN